MLKGFRKFLFIAIMGLALSSVPAGVAKASGYADTFGFGTRAMALGGAFTAVADNYAAAYYNPAGLGQIKGFEMTIDAMYINPSLHVEALDDNSDIVTTDARSGRVKNNPTEGGYGRDLDLPVPIVGLLSDMNVVSDLPIHLEMCMAMSMPEYMQVNYRVHDMPPDQPSFIRYGDAIDRVMLVVGIGAELLPGMVYAGAGVQSMIYGGGPGTAYEEGIAVGADDLAGTGSEQNILADMTMPSIQKYDPILGVLITPMGGMIKIGACWKDEQLYDTPSKTIAMAKVEIMAPTPPLFPDGITIPITQKGYMDLQDYFTPEEYSVGLAANIGPATISLQADKQKWRSYKYSQADACFYGEGPGFKNTINKRVGVEFKPDEKTSIMLGFCKQPTPVPSQSYKDTNYLDMDKKIFSVGFSKTMESPLTINPMKIGAMFQYQRLDDYTVYKDAAGVTWAEQESYTVKGDAWAGGISITNAW
jgi:long-chain fatty acid transport protein